MDRTFFRQLDRAFLVVVILLSLAAVHICMSAWDREAERDKRMSDYYSAEQSRELEAAYSELD